MEDFPIYFELGYDHISDLSNFDHILFLFALCAVYQIHQWKQVAWLVTAFTIGHSATLLLTALEVKLPPSELIKFLIPLTILITSFHNVLQKQHDRLRQSSNNNWKFNYVLALLFGLIHGMDFSNYFRVLFADFGNVVLPLLAFNIGIELGQLLIVLVVLIVSFVGLGILRIKQREWNLFISGATAGMALLSLLENKLW